ncbi:MAG: hypothetical protein M1822_002746 [Bathelium mastoideum]|nr:MAG: hypothetical protein M1822_002746 [Bathelium mastoideum]
MTNPQVSPARPDPAAEGPNSPGRPPSDELCDEQEAVTHWQLAASQAPQEHEGLIARLYQACISCLHDVFLHYKTRGDRVCSEKATRTLERAYCILKLWGDGYYVLKGSLDEKLKRSSAIKSEVLQFLRSIGKTLSRRSLPHDLYQSSVHCLTAQTGLLPYDGTQNIMRCAQILKVDLEEKTFVTEYYNDLSDSDSEHGADLVQDTGLEFLEEAIEDLVTDVECLQKLGPVLECPSQDLEPCEDSRLLDVEALSSTGHPFAESIKYKFPDADSALIDSLAQQNLARYLRLQKQRRINEQSENSEVLSLDARTIAPSSKFHDSGFEGSLVPPFAPSVVSGTAEGKRAGYPPLPDIAKEGKHFSCSACGRNVSVQSVTHWKKHLISDLQPYICVFPGCDFTPGPSETHVMSLWTSHLQKQHPLASETRERQCPLCMKNISPPKFVAHISRHLEDIALATLPPECEPEPNSENEDTPSKASSRSRQDHYPASQSSVHAWPCSETAAMQRLSTPMSPYCPSPFFSNWNASSALELEANKNPFTADVLDKAAPENIALFPTPDHAHLFPSDTIASWRSPHGIPQSLPQEESKSSKT